MANERLRALEDVEKEIAMVLQCAGEFRCRLCFTRRRQLQLTYRVTTRRGGLQLIRFRNRGSLASPLLETVSMCPSVQTRSGVFLIQDVMCPNFVVVVAAELQKRCSFVANEQVI